MTDNWREQPERGSSLALTMIRWIAVHFGRPAARLLLYPISLYFFITAGRARRMSRRFLARAGVERVSALDVFRHFHTFAAVILDRVYLMLGELDRFDIRLHLDEGVGEHLARERPAILIGGHLGSFDALRALGLHNRRARLRVLMHHDHNQLVTRVLEALNPEVTQTVIPLGRPETLLRTKEWLDEGGCVAMLGDRIFEGDRNQRGRSVTCEFLGGAADLPTGPLRLAGTLRVPVMLFFGIYRGGNRYDVHLEWFAQPEDLADHRQPGVIEAQVQRYATRLEQFSRDAPYNWFNFYEFWQSEDARGDDRT